MEVFAVDTSTGVQRCIEVHERDTLLQVKQRLREAFGHPDVVGLDLSFEGGAPLGCDDLDAVSACGEMVAGCTLRVAPNAKYYVDQLQSSQVTFQELPTWARQRPECVIAALEKGDWNTPNITPGLWGDKAVMIAAVSVLPELFHVAEPGLQEDIDFACAAVAADHSLIWRLGDTLQGDVRVVDIIAAQMPNEVNVLGLGLSLSRQAVLACLAKDPSAVRDVLPELWSQAGFVREVCTLYGGDCLERSSEALRDDEEVVLAACPRGLVFASTRLRNDPCFMQRAVEEEGLSLVYAGEALRGDKGLLLSALASCKWAAVCCDLLASTSAELCADRDVVAAAVGRCGDALQHASVELRGDPQLVWAAMAMCPEAFRHAAPELRDDMSFVQEVFEKHGAMLQHAGTALRDSVDVVEAALRCDAAQLAHASPRLRSKPQFLLRAVRIHWQCLQHAAPSAKADKSVVLEALRTVCWPEQCVALLRHVAPHLWDDAKVVAAATRMCSDKRAGAAQLKACLVPAPAVPTTKEGLMRAMRATLPMHVATLFEQASKELRTDRDVVLVAVSRSALLHLVDEPLRSDRAVLVAAASFTSAAIQHADPAALRDEGTIRALLSNAPGTARFMPALREDTDLLRIALSTGGRRTIECLGPALGQPDVVDHAMCVNTNAAWPHMPPSLRSCPQMAQRAVAGSVKLCNILGAARHDRRVSLMALRHDAANAVYLSLGLREDEEVAAAVCHAKKASMFRWLGPGARNDKRFALPAVQASPSNFLFAGPDMRADREVALAAFARDDENDKRALMYCASPSLQADREVALAAVRRNKAEFVDIAPELQEDAELLELRFNS